MGRTVAIGIQDFGKTFNMSMLEHSFSNKYAGLGEIFEGLSIWKDEKYRALQGTLINHSVSAENIRKYGFAFEGKTVLKDRLINSKNEVMNLRIIL